MSLRNDFIEALRRHGVSWYMWRIFDAFMMGLLLYADQLFQTGYALFGCYMLGILTTLLGHVIETREERERNAELDEALRRSDLYMRTRVRGELHEYE